MKARFGEHPANSAIPGRGRNLGNDLEVIGDPEQIVHVSRQAVVPSASSSQPPAREIESDTGKEHQIVVQERGRWLAGRRLQSSEWALDQQRRIANHCELQQLARPRSRKENRLTTLLERMEQPLRGNLVGQRRMEHYATAGT
jgi:hypothetical protein